MRFRSTLAEPGCAYWLRLLASILDRFRHLLPRVTPELATINFPFTSTDGIAIRRRSDRPGPHG